MRPVAWGSLFRLICIGIYLQILWKLLSVDLQLKWTQYCIHYCGRSLVEVILPETRAMLITSKPQSASILQHNFALCSAICEVYLGRQLMTTEIQVQTSVFMTHMSLPSSFHWQCTANCKRPMFNVEYYLYMVHTLQVQIFPELIHYLAKDSFNIGSIYSSAF